MEFQKVYFLGIGGIGMSALARYFLHEGKKVAGYDRTPSHLTDELSAEGAAIHFEDDVRLIPAEFLDPAATMVVYTPAVPQEHGEYRYFADHGFRIEKRSQMLGHLAEGKYVMAVAGTHGKTTTSTLVAWLNRALTGGGSAFLGGISKNFGGNLVLDGCGVQGMRPPAGEGCGRSVRQRAGFRMSPAPVLWAGGWPSRPTSSTVRSCGSIPMWRWSRRPTPTTSTFTGRTRR